MSREDLTDQEKVILELREVIRDGEVDDKEDLNKKKLEIAGRYSLSEIPSNADIIEDMDKKYQREFQRKPTRTISGVAVVAIMSRPWPCPHGQCDYCPGGPTERDEGSSPQSYTGEEPAAMRAEKNKYDPYKQVHDRLSQLDTIGHAVDKIELILMGGTFLSQTLDYQKWFVREALRAMNDYPENNLDSRETDDHYFFLEDVQKNNESSSNRCVGITFETRPDWCKEEEIDRMLDLGATRVEVGVQTTFDFIYKRNNRGHTVKDVIESTRLLKNSALKINYHMMPGMPGSSRKRDLKSFDRIFNDSKFKPDMLKIYPSLVVKGTETYKMWKKDDYHPYDTEEARELILKAMKKIPRWVRVMRIQRDIPANLIEAGVKKSNLGQLVNQALDGQNYVPKEIRSREVGRAKKRGREPDLQNIKLYRTNYKASNGQEIFLSFEDRENKIIIGFIRIRLPKNSRRPEVDKNTALIRELHVYGPVVSLGEKGKEEWQHQNYGRKLLKKAEEIAKQREKNKMAIISGIGVREYYKKQGYSKEGPYMSKIL